MFCDIVECGTRGDSDAAIATATLGWQAMHQASLDGGTYQVAERASRMKDPFGKKKFVWSPE